MNKKRLVILVSLITLMVISMCFASAYQFPISDLKTTSENIIQAVGDIISPFLKFLLGDDVTGFNQYFFQRCLLLALIFAITYLVLKRIDLFRSKKGFIILISAIVAILGARYISDIGLVELVLLPYGAFAISLTVLLPFIIYFYFIHNSGLGTAGRRIAWILFAVVFFGLWLTRMDTIGQYNWIYTIGVIAVIIVVIFDKTIHRYFELGKFKRTEKEPIIRKYLEVEKAIEDLERRYGGKDAADVPSEIRRYWKTLIDSEKNLRKNIS